MEEIRDTALTYSHLQEAEIEREEFFNNKIRVLETLALA